MRNASPATPPFERGEEVAVRWTVGDVSRAGFEALRLSIWGAWRCFGPTAQYAVCVNNVSADAARRRTGEVPAAVRWLQSETVFPDFLRPFLDGGLAQGCAWKLAPIRLFPDHYELALDNDCILWRVPRAARDWIAERHPRRCLIAADVLPCFGAFAAAAGRAPRNAGIRGLPPGLDFAAMIKEVLHANPSPLRGQVDEQGLQVAAVRRAGRPHVVPVREVTICSPFPPRHSHLGRSGAHFVDLNVCDPAFRMGGRPAVPELRAHWRRHRERLHHLVGLPPPDAGS